MILNVYHHFYCTASPVDPKMAAEADAAFFGATVPSGGGRAAYRKV